MLQAISSEPNKEITSFFFVLNGTVVANLPVSTNFFYVAALQTKLLSSMNSEKIVCNTLFGIPCTRFFLGSIFSKVATLFY